MVGGRGTPCKCNRYNDKCQYSKSYSGNLSPIRSITNHHSYTPLLFLDLSGVIFFATLTRAQEYLLTSIIMWKAQGLEVVEEVALGLLVLGLVWGLVLLE